MEDKTLKEDELKKVNGGLLIPPLSKHHCNDCGYEFHEPENKACPHCGSKNIIKRW